MFSFQKLNSSFEQFSFHVRCLFNTFINMSHLTHNRYFIFPSLWVIYGTIDMWSGLVVSYSHKMWTGEKKKWKAAPIYICYNIAYVRRQVYVIKEALMCILLLQKKLIKFDKLIWKKNEKFFSVYHIFTPTDFIANFVWFIFFLLFMMNARNDV